MTTAPAGALAAGEAVDAPGVGRRGAWLAGYALVTFLAFPQPWGDRVVDLGAVLAYLSPAALLLCVRGLSPRRALRWGFAAALAGHALVLHWIYVVTVVYGHGPPPVGVVAVLGLAAFVAAFPAGFAAGSAWLRARGADGPLCLAALWTLCEYLRGVAFSGFPWAGLGYALHLDPRLMELAPFAGVYGLSFAAALGGAALADLLGGRPRRAALGLAVLAALHAVGAVLDAGHRPLEGPGLRVAVVQGNIDQGAKWSPEWADRTLGRYEELTLRAAAQGAQVVVWPETAAPGSPDVDPVLRSRLVALAQASGATLVVGAVGIDGYDPGRPETRATARFFDSAFLIDAQGRFQDRYDKSHLVPFGEFVPFRALLGRFVKAVATGIASGDVTPGAAPRALFLEPAQHPEPRVSVGVPICYELLFPDLMRRFVGDGAQALLAITNDAWYGRTGAPHQFLAMTALRSAESRVWAARAANTGVSAFIDEQGRVRSRTRIFERDLLVADLPLRSPERPRTFYVRHGDVFVLAGGLGLIGAIALRARRGGGLPSEGDGDE